MVLLDGGEFTMGTDDGEPFEGPSHRVRVSPFYLDEHEVTNRQYAAFATDTGYVTESEKLGWSGVFDPRRNGWTKGDGADWRHPHGPGSSHDQMPDYPVVHLSWADAVEYCGWRGARLPTEAEFEFAARGGIEGAKYAWGNELTPGGVHQANLWQGIFPNQDRTLDGYGSHGPVKKFPPNGYGLYDMTGNVWEWVQDWYAPDYFRYSPVDDPKGPRTGDQKVQRGGSWLCSENYCQGYRVAARQMTAPDSGLNNLGFRCAGDAP
jgi:formylglycine-generating enzyme required for sulfatase activity